MQKSTLMAGLFQVAAAVGLCVAGAASGAAGLAVVFALGAALNAFCGADNLMEGCFGRDGLVCEVFPATEASKAK